MGSYKFTWQHPADEVWVTGTFDKWSKSTKLDRIGTGYEKTVSLPNTEKILYKFVADGEWKYDHTAQTETDHEGNVNNVLYPSDIMPAVDGAFDPTTSTVAGAAATTAAAATEGVEPLEPATGSADAPGAFPETPADEGEQTFSVKPIPATGGIGNPVQLAPGEPVPDPSTLTSNTVDSTVKTDQASYEKSDASAPYNPPSNQNTSSMGAGFAAMFGLGPQTTNMVPESSMPRGEQTPADISKENIGPTISSVSPQSTTAQMAGQVPLEQNKEEEDDNKDNSTLYGKMMAGAAALGIGAAGTAVAANELVKDKTGVDAKSKLPEDMQKTIDDNAQYSAAAVGQTALAVPEEVTDSQKQAMAAPEASSNAEAVQEKSAMEKELLSEVKTTDATGEPAPTTATEAAAAIGVPREVVESQKEALAAPEAAANPVAVQEKSAMESQLLSAVKTTDASGTPAPTPSAATTTTAPLPTNMSDTPVASTAIITDIPAAAAAPLASDSAATKSATTTSATTTAISSGPSPPQLSVTGAPQIGHPTGGGLEPINMNDKSGLNATKDTPAETGVQQSALQTGQPADSRDISPMSKPATATAGQTQPSVTTGVDSGKAPAQSAAATAAAGTTTAGTTAGASAPSTPQKVSDRLKDSTPESSSKTSGTPDSKKEKRRSLFGRIKDKLKA